MGTVTGSMNLVVKSDHVKVDDNEEILDLFTLCYQVRIPRF
jgi:hypothetical protein